MPSRNVGPDPEPVRLSFDPPPNFAPQDSPAFDPPERQIAWLEYFGGLMVESEDLQRAEEVAKELYQRQMLMPNLQYKIGLAMQSLQSRIDARYKCRLKHCNSADCLHTNHPADRAAARDITSTAMNNLAKVMTESPIIGKALPLNASDKVALERIYFTLKQGDLPDTMRLFEALLRGRSSLLRNEAVSRLNFVLKMMRFDLENPDNCLPLWRDTCELDWRRKHDILDAFDALKRRITDPRQVWPRLAKVPASLQMEIRTRLSVQLRLAEAWAHLGYLPRPDQYVAQACLFLKHVPPPGLYPSTEHIGNVRSARPAAKNIYHACLRDPNISMLASALCRMGWTQIASLEQSCPYSGFVRMGLFPLVFDDYLFIKCQNQYQSTISRPLYFSKTPPFSDPLVRSPTSPSSPLPSPPPSPPPLPPPSPPPSPPRPHSFQPAPAAPKPKRPKCNMARQIAKLYRLERILDQAQTQIEELKPMHCEVRKMRENPPGQRWRKTQESMGRELRAWTEDLRTYLQQFEEGEPDKKRMAQHKSRADLIRQVKDALSELAET